MNTEESFPLLLLFLEEGTAKKKKGFFVDKNRYNRIYEGASNVFTQWPGHVSNSWLSGFVFLLLFVLVLLIVLASTIRPVPHLPVCSSFEMDESNTKIYLVHHDEIKQRHQFKAIEEIIENYPQMKIDLIFLTNALKKARLQKIRVSRRKWKTGELNINVGNKSVIKNIKFEKVIAENVTLTVPIVKNMNELLKKYPLISVRSESIESFFTFTPLHSAWKRLNLELIEFAARVMMLWEYGGISFKLPEYTSDSDRINTKPKISVHNTADFYVLWGFESFIKSNATSYTNLPPGVVNIDDEGLHMETKTPCHAYFGEMIALLRAANRSTCVDDVVRSTLKTFCGTGAVDDEYCLNFI